jgi:tetratricopeptide (TPR) repeat protein
VADTVEEILAASDDIDRGIARDVLGEVLGLPPGGSLVATAGPQIRRSSLIRSLGLVLGALAEEAPLVLVLEDLHWLDPASAEILEALLTEAAGRRLLVLATQRPGWSAPWSSWGWTERLALRPLPDVEAAALAGAVLGGGRLSPPLEEYLRERAEGNPYFVEELVRCFQETGGLEMEGGEVRLLPGVGERLPATLTEVLLARLDRLERQVKGVAQVGSVIGRSFAVRLLARVMEREEALLDGPLRALRQAEIAFPRGGRDPEYVFQHVMLRDAAYGMLVRRRRRELHLAVGRAMAQLYPPDEYVERIAYHFARTEEDAEAAGWLERAGDRARATYANEAAIAHYQAVLERLERCGTDEGKLAGIEERLGEVLFQVGRYVEAQAVLERSVERYRRAGRVEDMGRAMGRLGYVLFWQGEMDEVRWQLEPMAATLAERGPSAASSEVQVCLSFVFEHLGRFPEMLGAAEQAVAMARAVADDGLCGRAQERRGTALVYLGRIEESRQALDEAVTLNEATGDLDKMTIAVGNLGWNWELTGELTEAARLYERALDLARRTGGVRELWLRYSLHGLLVTTGEWERAGEQLARAREIAAARGTAGWIAPWLPWQLGELALREGDWEGASQQLGRAAELARGANPEILERAEAALAELAILEGRAELARQRLQPLLEEAGANLPFLLPVLAWAYLELGETKRALELAEQAERETRKRQTLLSLPQALRIKGMALSRLGRSAEAREVLMEGRERAAGMPNPYGEARILVELGLLDQQEGKTDQTREQLQQARTIFQRLGARKDIERTEQELAQLARA